MPLLGFSDYRAHPLTAELAQPPRPRSSLACGFELASVPLLGGL